MALNHKFAKWVGAAVAVLVLATAATRAGGVFDGQDGRGDDRSSSGRKAKNVILFIGDGMGVSTVTATRVYSVGVSGQLWSGQGCCSACATSSRSRRLASAANAGGTSWYKTSSRPLTS